MVLLRLIMSHQISKSIIIINLIQLMILKIKKELVKIKQIILIALQISNLPLTLIDQQSNHHI